MTTRSGRPLKPARARDAVKDSVKAQPPASGSTRGSSSASTEPRTETRTTEGDTRRHIMALLLKHGPSTATFLGEELNLSAAGIRRHLDNLVEDGLTEIVHRRGNANSGRGRPAKYFRLTDTGRSYFGHAYDALANDALSALREAGGSAAVKQFAIQRLHKLLGEIPEHADPAETAKELAKALDAHGYAATVTGAGGGVQICQHHCPVAHVAAENPELCEAEQEVFAQLLGKHVQPLASIADGHGICTTNIPLTPVTNSLQNRIFGNHNNERSGS